MSDEHQSGKQSANTTVARMIDALIAREGGFSDHPADRGGATRWGITEAVARDHGYEGDMAALPRDTAVTIYRNIYWDKPGFAAIAERAPSLAEELFDTGVNMGPAIAAGFLQRILNALNRNGRDFADLVVDHAIGPRTLAALDRFLRLRGSPGEAVLVKAADSLQCARYIQLAESRPANAAFVFGWLSQRVG